MLREMQTLRHPAAAVSARLMDDEAFASQRNIEGRATRDYPIESVQPLSRTHTGRWFSWPGAVPYLPLVLYSTRGKTVPPLKALKRINFLGILRP